MAVYQGFFFCSCPGKSYTESIDLTTHLTLTVSVIVLQIRKKYKLNVTEITLLQKHQHSVKNPMKKKSILKVEEKNKSAAVAAV